MYNCFIGFPNNLDCCSTVSVCFFQYTPSFFTDIGASLIDEVTVASFSEAMFNKIFSERNNAMASTKKIEY